MSTSSPLFTLAAADYLADAHNKQVDCRNGLSVIVQAHIESLNLLGIICNENGALEDTLGQAALVLCLEVAAPIDFVVELVVVLLKLLDGVGISDARKIGADNGINALKQTLINELVKELKLRLAALHNIGDDILYHRLCELHIILKIGKSNLGLDHP